MPATGRGGVQTNLPLNAAPLAQFESRNVARERRRVGAGCGEEVASAAGREDDVGAVHFRVQRGVAWWDERVGVIIVDGLVRLGVDGVAAEAVAGFHEGVERARVFGEFDPAGMVIGGWGGEGGDEG